MSDTIAAKNDALRKTFTGGQILLSQGVQALDPALKALALRAFQEFDDFNITNDPSGDHSYFTFTVNGQRFVAEAEYFAPDMVNWQDPLDPTTVYCFHLMLSEEY